MPAVAAAVPIPAGDFGGAGSSFGAWQGPSQGAVQPAAHAECVAQAAQAVTEVSQGALQGALHAAPEGMPPATLAEGEELAGRQVCLGLGGLRVKG